MYYGLVKKEHAIDIVDAVVKVLGGDENAKLLLLETAQQETHMGAYKDKTDYAAGTGVCQFDEMPYYDVIRRTRNKHLHAIKEEFDIEMTEVKWRELEHNPLLSFIACRLKYILIPEAIPKTVKGRAAYWKEHYNTVAGKGTEEEYIKNAGKLKKWMG